jgi:GAF domain-containing protein
MRLQTRLAIAFSLFSVLASIIVASGMYAFARQQMIEAHRQRLLDIVSVAAQRVDGNQHALLRQPEQQNSREYLQIKSVLQEIRDSATDLRFVYTMRYIPEDDQIIFIVDAETSPEDISNLGDVYEELERDLLETLANLDQPFVEKEPIVDRWGVWISAYAPIYTSGGRKEAILGIDMPLEQLQAYQNQYLFIAVLMTLVSLPVMAGLGWLVGGRLAAPVSRLTQNSQKLVDEDDLPTVMTGAMGNAVEFHLLEKSIVHLSKYFKQRIGGMQELLDQSTSQLSQRETFLQVANELTRSIYISSDPQIFANQAVELIQQRLKLYHVGLFLVQAEQAVVTGERPIEWAVLKAAAGEGALALLQRGLRQVVPAGLVGWSIANAEPRVAQSRQGEDIRLTTPEIPRTVSEAALPLRWGGQVIGALNLHSQVENAFGSKAIQEAMVLADLIAAGLNQAPASKEDVDSLRLDSGDFSGGSSGQWMRDLRQMFSERAGWGYRANSGEEASYTDDEWAEHMRSAAQSGQITVGEQGEIAVPLLVRDQVMGVLNIEPGTSAAGNHRSQWSAEQIDILRAIAEDIGQALEAAYLYQETRLSAARQRLSSEVATQVRSSLDLNAVLQIAARQIGEKLGPALQIEELEIALGDETMRLTSEPRRGQG